MSQLVISIHALREEGDTKPSGPTMRSTRFLSTPSARRATPGADHGCSWLRYFYPRPPRGGRPGVEVRAGNLWEFLSTPSARRATVRLNDKIVDRKFLSTPSARRATSRVWADTALDDVFLSTPSARRATPRLRRLRSRMEVFLSTPSARRATLFFLYTGFRISDFYPRPPRGGRRHIIHHLSE